ncbi:unnamed protein product, partial [Didymodactylos carnosus]
DQSKYKGQILLSMSIIFQAASVEPLLSDD